MEIDHEIFSMVILSLLLIQEVHLSVSGERMCTILVNCLEDYVCPVKLWLGKLTYWVDWAVKPQHKQTNQTYFESNHYKNLTEVLLMSTHNICYHGQITIILFGYHS